MKMKDEFELPIETDGTNIKDKLGSLLLEFGEGFFSEKQLKYICHAVNTHDQLQERLDATVGALRWLTNNNCGVSKAGGDLRFGELEESIQNGINVLNKFQALSQIEKED